MPPKGKAKKNQDAAEGHPDLSSPQKDKPEDDCVVTAGDLTKSTTADTKPKAAKRGKKDAEEAKAPAGKKVKRNRTNLQDAKLIAMCKELGIDINNIDPNDTELKAILQAACAAEESDKEENSPVKAGDDEEASQF